MPLFAIPGLIAGAGLGAGGGGMAAAGTALSNMIGGAAVRGLAKWIGGAFTTKKGRANSRARAMYNELPASFRSLVPFDFFEYDRSRHTGEWALEHYIPQHASELTSGDPQVYQQLKNNLTPTVGNDQFKRQYFEQLIGYFQQWMASQQGQTVAGGTVAGQGNPLLGGVPGVGQEQQQPQQPGQRKQSWLVWAAIAGVVVIALFIGLRK